MNEFECYGLNAEKPLNWLAAIGASVLVDGLRVSWTEDLNPYAVLSAPFDPLTALAARWPSEERVKDMPLVRHLLENPKQDIPRDAYQELIRGYHHHKDAWTITSAATDLTGTVEAGSSVRGPLTPGLQGKASPQTNMAKIKHPDRDAIKHALLGTALRSKGAGTGLDPDRFTNPMSGEKGVSTVHEIEMLAFFGLSIFPVRGAGKISDTNGWLPRQRGWNTYKHRLGDFRYPVWRQPLDLYAIDALIDAWHPRNGHAALLGVHGSYRSVRRDHLPGAQYPTFGYAGKYERVSQ